MPSAAKPGRRVRWMGAGRYSGVQASAGRTLALIEQADSDEDVRTDTPLVVSAIQSYQKSVAQPTTQYAKPASSQPARTIHPVGRENLIEAGVLGKDGKPVSEQVEKFYRKHPGWR